MTGLEDKLEGIHVGDLITLGTTGGDRVVGFVWEYTSTNVVLSHEHPGNSGSYGNNHFPRVTIGNRKYHLQDFAAYKILDPIKVV